MDGSRRAISSLAFRHPSYVPKRSFLLLLRDHSFSESVVDGERYFVVHSHAVLFEFPPVST